MVRSESNRSDRNSRQSNHPGKSQETNYSFSAYGNIESEALFLGALLRHPSLFFQLHTHLSEQDFIERTHKAIFESMVSLYLNGVDKLTPMKLAAEAQSLGLTGCDDIHAVSSDIINHPITETEALQHFSILKKETTRRSYLEDFSYLFDYIKDTTDTTQSIIKNVEEKILGKAQNIANDKTSLRNLAGEAWDIIQELAEDPGAIGLDIGFPYWQNYIGQLRNGTLHMVAANTGVGKSIFGIAAAIYIARTYRVPVLICDSELNQTDQTIRAYGIYYKVPFNIIESGYWKLSEDELRAKKLNDEQIVQILDAKRKFEDEDLRKDFAQLPITYKTINEMSVVDAIPFMRQWFAQQVKKKAESRKVPNCFIVFDYLKLGTVDELKRGGIAIQEYQSLGLNCSALHNFAQEYCLPILTFGQTNREIDDNLNCIAASKRLTELCDSVSLLKEKTPENRHVDPDGNYLMRVFKSRYGKRTGINHINIEFVGEIGSFKEIGMGDLVPRKDDKDDDDS